MLLFVIYQIAEANGQEILRIPWKPLSTFILFILVIMAAELVAHFQKADGLAAYGMGFAPGWWQSYLFGVLLGIIAQLLLEMIGWTIGIRRILGFRFSVVALLKNVVWILFANFPAAAAEDLLTRGYPFRFLQTLPLAVFMLLSAFLYFFNHIIRLVTKPITDWYHLPFTGLTLAYVLAQTGSLWPVIGLHQSSNVIFYCMQQMMEVKNTDNKARRVIYGIISELCFFLLVILIYH